MTSPANSSGSALATSTDWYAGGSPSSFGACAPSQYRSAPLTSRIATLAARGQVSPTRKTVTATPTATATAPAAISGPR